MKHVLACAPALLICLATAACADDDNSSGQKLYCPTVSRVAQLSSLTRFLPSGEDITTEITQAQITGIAGSCNLEAAKHAVAVTFKIGFTATNGPANHAASLDLPYFVSIAQGGEIISKTPYTISVGFDGNVTSAGTTSKPVTVELPNVPDTQNDEILVGFQLSPEQLTYATDHPGS